MKKFLKDKSGVSIIIALILLIMFLTIGAAVLTAATTTAGGATQLSDSRKAYYFCENISRSIKDGILSGDTGDIILKEAEKRFNNGEELPFNIIPEVTQSNIPDEFLNSDGKLNADIVFMVNDYADEGGKVKISYMVCGVTAKYGDQSYILRMKFKYNSADITAGGSNGWEFQKYL